MINRIENGMLEHYKARTKCILPSVLSSNSNVLIEEDGIKIPKETFIQNTFPHSEFTIVIDLMYEFLNKDDFILIYLAKDKQKSGIKIENDFLINYSKFKITKTTTMVSVYYLDEFGKWIFVSSFTPNFVFENLGFYGTIDFTIVEFSLYKNPFLRFFIEEDDIDFLINGEIINKVDNYFLYEYMPDYENQEIELLIVKNNLILTQMQINATIGDVFFYIKKNLYIDDLKLEDYNFLDESYKNLRLVNGGNSIEKNIRIFATSEPAIEILFKNKENVEYVNELLIPILNIGESIDFTFYVRKKNQMPYHRYNFNILVE